MIAECPEGFGEDKFAEWMHNASDFEYLYKKIKEKFVLGGHKAVAVSKLLTKAKILLYSSFDTATTNQMGFGKINSIQDYINSRLSEDKDLRFAVVPNGRFIRLSR
jgi:nickel-dependent lactate racemase